MCFGGGDDASSALEEQEKKRSMAIQAGTANINRVFSGFNPEFYEGVRRNTISSLLPQAERQYRRTRQQLGYGLASRGLMSSSFGKKAATELEFDRNVAQQTVVNQGNEAVRDVKSQVQNQKMNLTNQLVTSQDPNLAAQQAIAGASTIHAPSPIAPLGNLFQTFANTYLGYRMGQTFNQPDDQPRMSSPSAGGSNRIQK